MVERQPIAVLRAPWIMGQAPTRCGRNCPNRKPPDGTVGVRGDGLHSVTGECPLGWAKETRDLLMPRTVSWPYGLHRLTVSVLGTTDRESDLGPAPA